MRLFHSVFLETKYLRGQFQVHSHLQLSFKSDMSSAKIITKKSKNLGSCRDLNPGPLANMLTGVTLSENHTTRPQDLDAKTKIY